MARFPQPQAKKGSQKWIQKLVNDKPEFLNSKIWSALNLSEDEYVQWLSPLKSDEYAEYRDHAFLDLLNIRLEKTSLAQFWPKGGPQWDALGKSSSGKLFLIEGKSHISELMSSLRAEDEESRKKIHESLEETKRYLDSKIHTDWSQGFYQHTNRLAHLYLLRSNNLPAYLVHVYFLKDFEMKGPDTYHEWEGAIRLVELYLGIGRHKLRKFTANVYIDLQDLVDERVLRNFHA
jgi:hypothetical protein